MSNENPPITLFLRLFTLFEVVVLVVAGVGVFFLADVTRPIWPWDIPPFNAAFIGAIYLASVPAIGMLALIGRWAPARLVLAMLLTFTGIGLVASVLNLGDFQFQRWTAWFWFFLYISLPINSVIHLWLYRRRPPAQPISIPAAWRYYLLVQGFVLILYGVGQFVVPLALSSFWPWKIDAFHGQLYSGAFVATAVGGVLISRWAARLEFLAQGLSQIRFGLFAVGGLVLVDATAHRVNWSALGTWAWIGGFTVLTGAGLGMLWHWRTMQWAAAK